jgi:hypothetical protein
MNANFVSIKVDREERPDVDNIYMTFVQATTGSGGWPMNVWLTPDLKPFVGGAYFAATEQHGLPSFRTVLLRIAEARKSKHDQLVASSKEITSQLATIVQPSDSAGQKVSRDILQKAYSELAHFFDSKYGGFADAPKFPRSVVLNFLLHTYAASPDSPDGKHALEMTLFTLRKMAEGGIHDQLGGDFHRYSVDDDRCIDGALAARMDVRPAGRRLGVHRISDRSTTQYCRARRWPVFAGHPHSLRIRSISPADTGKGRTTLGRRTKDTLEYDREINAQSAIGCDS